MTLIRCPGCGHEGQVRTFEVTMFMTATCPDCGRVFKWDPIGDDARFKWEEDDDEGSWEEREGWDDLETF